MSVMNPDAMPALYGYCEQVYKEMDKESERDADGNKIWRGAGTKLLASLNLSNPYYSHIMKALQRMDCIRQIRRGGGGQPSVWHLVQPPTSALWKMGNKDVDNKPAAQKQADQALRVMHERVSTLETKVEVLEARLEELNG